MAAVFQRQEVLERLDGDEDLLQELVAIFLEHAHQQVQRLREALGTGNAPDLVHQAHSLKGAATGLGAEALGMIAARLELAGKSGRLADAPHLPQALEEELARFREAVAL